VTGPDAVASPLGVPPLAEHVASLGEGAVVVSADQATFGTAGTALHVIGIEKGASVPPQLFAGVRPMAPDPHVTPTSLPHAHALHARVSEMVSSMTCLTV
jgi:hypothetical protein